MAQHDYVIANASGATVRADINSALSAIQTLNSGTSEPSSTAAGMLWLDTTGGAPYALKVRDAGNNHWLTLGNVTDPGADGNLELLPGKINLPSSGGIYESDGSTQVLTESGGSVTIQNATFNGTIGTSASGFGLVTHADHWRYDTNYTSGSGFLTTTSNFQQVTSADSSSGGIGSSMTQDSGVFTFPATGIWLIMVKATFQATSGGISYAGLRIYVTTNNSSYNERSVGYSNMDDTNYYQTHHNMYMFDCQDTTTHKVKFNVDVSNSSASFRGSSTFNYNEFTFIRLGDT